MHIPKEFLRDRTVLLILAINSFLTILGTFLILWRFGSGQGGNYIVSYRANLGISAYSGGQSMDILAFVVFLFFVLVMNTLLSLKIYTQHRSYALTMLGFGTLLSLLAVIVSNALLILR